LRVLYIGSQPQRNRNPQFAKDQNSASKGRIFYPHGNRVTVGNDANIKGASEISEAPFHLGRHRSSKRSERDLIVLCFSGYFLVVATQEFDLPLPRSPLYIRSRFEAALIDAAPGAGKEAECR